MNIFLQQRPADVLAKVNKNHRFFRYLQFVIGMILVAAAFNLFLSPNNLVPGGVSGIAILLESLFKLDPSTVILIAGIFLLIASYFLLGIEKTKASILGTILFPVCVKLTENLPNIIEVHETEILLIAVFAGAIYGFGAGMIFKAGFTTGGTDIVNQIISKYFKISIGKSMLWSDGFIVLASFFVFGGTKLMYAIIILYIISVMSDKVILGISDSKSFYIITDHEKEIKDYILKSLNHGVTVFNAKGGYDHDNKEVLMCVIPSKEYYVLKEGIHQIDDKAFFIVTDAYEVFGGE